MGRSRCGSVTPANSCSRRLGRNTRKILLGLRLLGIANRSFSTTFRDRASSQVFRATAFMHSPLKRDEADSIPASGTKVSKKEAAYYNGRVRRASTSVAEYSEIFHFFYSTRQKQ